ncbi:MAG: hypothetical protein ABI599_06075 [Flavobacteriales bacterium]
MKPTIWKSIGAVLAGFLTAAVLSTAMDAVLHATGVFPEGPDMSNGLYALATTYRVLFQVLGGYLTARLAPARPMKHVWILAGIGQVLSLLGIIAWSVVGGPLWYPLALVATAIPSVWLGGYSFKRADHSIH